MIVLFFILGVISWTLTEYLLHRFLGHVFKGNNFFKKEHLMHHSKVHYFAPAYKKIVSAIVVASLLFLLISLISSFAIAIGYVLGFVGMYGLYEITHARFHRKDPITQPFIILRKHHFYHHFHNPKMNHGVTSRFWDRVFGTFQEVEVVKIPKKMSMNWLMDNNEIKEIYKSHFVLV